MLTSGTSAKMSLSFLIIGLVPVVVRVRVGVFNQTKESAVEAVMVGVSTMDFAGQR